jgi:prophage tail gpP-like protein
MAFKPDEVAEITVNGMRYRDWKSVTVKLAEGESNNTFRLTVSEGRPLASRWADMQIRPGDHCTITLGGELAITGYVETRQVAYTAEQHGIEIIGVSHTKAAADGAAMTETQEFRKESFQQIGDKLLPKHGIKLVPKTALPGKPFHRASIAPGQSTFEFLESLARMRGITLGTDTQGNMTARTAWTGGGAMLIEGVNILEGREVMTVSQGEGPNYADGQHGGTNENFGRKVAGPTANSQANVNPGGKGVHAANKQIAEQPADKDDAQMRSKMESQQRGAEQLQVTIVVVGWKKPGGGGLWKPGEKVHVKSPMLIVDEDLDLVTATFTQDDKKGTLTTLELKRPGEADGKDKGSGEDYSKSGSTSSTSSTPAADARPPSLGE